MAGQFLEESSPPKDSGPIIMVWLIIKVEWLGMHVNMQEPVE